MTIDLSALAPLAGSLARAGLPTLGNILSAAAPFPFSLFVGPAFAAITAALGVDPNAPAAAAQVQAQIDADPADAAAKLQAVEDEHKSMADAANEELRLRLLDMQDARATMVSTIKEKSILGYMPAALTLLNYGAFFFVAYWFASGHNVTDPNGNLLVGAIIASYASDRNFWMGANQSSSKRADQAIDLAQRALPLPTVVTKRR